MYGRIVTEAGRPLPGVVVSLVEALGEYEDGQLLLDGRSHPPPTTVSRSDAKGSFRLIAPEPGPWIVRTVKPGFAPMALELMPLLEESDLPTLEMAPVHKVNIEVSSARGGEPVAGARVLVTRPLPKGLLAPAFPEWHLDRQLARTSREGKALVEIGQRSSLSAWIVADGFSPRVVRDSRGSGWHVKLEPAAQQPLTVVDHRGQPGREVLVWPSWGGLPIARSDELGRLELPVHERTERTDRHHREGDDLKLRFLARDFGALERSLRSAENQDSTDEGHALPNRVMLDPPQMLDGRVLAGPGPEPLAGAFVWREQATIAFVRTGRGGEYSVPQVPWYEGAIRIGASGYFGDRVERGALDRLDGEDRLPTVVLHPSSAIAGLVTDSEGHPVEGVEVYAHSDPSALRPFRFNPPYWERRAGGSARTHSDGRFRVGGLIPGLDQILRFRRDGFAPRKLDWPAPEPGEAGDPLQVILARGIVAVGRVLDSDGEPIEGASVRLTEARPGDVVERARQSRRREPVPAFTAETDRSGRFRVTDLPEQPLDLAVRAIGFATTEVPGIRAEPIPDGPADLGTVVLAPEARIEGRVEDPAGAPIAGAAVRVLPESPLLALSQDVDLPEPDALSGGDGHFSFGGLTAGETVRLRVDRDGYALAVIRAARAGGDPVTVVLAPETSLAGRVVDRSDAPIADALVYLVDSDGTKLSGGRFPSTGKPTPLVDRTDDDGSFLIHGVEPGRVEVFVEAVGWQDWQRTIDLGDPEKRPADLDVVLDRAAVVEGIVRDSSGVPVIGAEIRRWEADLPAGTIAYQAPLATSDGEGAYRIEDLAPGSVRLEARRPEGGRAVREIEALAGDNHLDFQLEGGETIAGSVVDPMGLPVPLARVVLESRRPSWTPPVAMTDASGAFTFEGLSEGDYVLRAEKRGVGRSDGAVSVHLPRRSEDELVVELAPEGTVRGRITGLSLDELTRVRVQAGPLLDVASVDYEGRYRITDLSLGRWTIVAEIPETGRRASGQAVLDEEAPDAVVDLDFGVGLRLSGAVVSTEGGPVAGATVVAHGEGGISPWTTTDEEGRFEMSGLPSGHFDLEVTTSDPTSETWDSVELDSDRTVRVVVSLIGSDRSLRGRGSGR